VARILKILGSAESESFAIFSEIRANQIRIQIPNLKKIYL
jgi:hypothetical protein